ncbi:MAG TPA: hypothetical protein VFZ11_00130 [Gemmatimonadaceae bacterium]
MPRMRSFAAPLARAALALAVLAAAALPAEAQTRERWLKSPVLVVQPGFVIADAIDAPDGVDARTDLLLRLVTAVPTAIPRAMLVFAVQWSPFADENGAGVAMNQPELHYGPILHVWEGDRIAVDLGVLGAYGPSATVEDIEERAYSHKLRLQGDLLVKLGRMLMPESTSRLSSAALYLTLAHLATGVDADIASPWTVQGGISLPIAP